MHAAALPRVAVAALIVTLAGCDKNGSSPTTVRGRSAPLALRTPTARTTSIRQRVAAKRHQGLTSDERARVAAAGGKWKWAGDLHHQAMQQAIHDPALHGLRGQHSAAERCAVALDYARKFGPAAERQIGHPMAPATVQEASLKSGLAQEGLCESGPKQASIFAAAPTPTFRVTPPAATAVTAANRATAQQLADGYGDYLNAMLADLQGAKDLADANDIMDHYVAAAQEDAALGATGAALVAGTIDLARSSAQEWDDFARPREGSMFLWGWLSAIGDWIVSVVTSDIYGCAWGVGFELGTMADYGFYGTLDEFVEETAGYCAAFGIASSIGAAF